MTLPTFLNHIRDYADAIGGLICIGILLAPFVALAWTGG